jgi:hypothetical protein
LPPPKLPDEWLELLELLELWWCEWWKLLAALWLGVGRVLRGMLARR